MATKPVLVKATSLSDSHQKLYKTYRDDYKKASESAKALAMAVNAQWTKTYPQGKDNRFATFNAVFGKLYVEWKDSRRGKGEPFSEDEGEDVF